MRTEWVKENLTLINLKLIKWKQWLTVCLLLNALFGKCLWGDSNTDLGPRAVRVPLLVLRILRPDSYPWSFYLFKPYPNDLSYCRFCIYTHPINSKFTIWQAHDLLTCQTWRRNRHALYWRLKLVTTCHALGSVLPRRNYQPPTYLSNTAAVNLPCVKCFFFWNFVLCTNIKHRRRYRILLMLKENLPACLEVSIPCPSGWASDTRLGVNHESDVD